MDITYLLTAIVIVVVIVLLIRRGKKGAASESFTGNADPGYQAETPATRDMRPAEATGNMEATVRALLNDGNKIEAIKRVRGHTGLGLKEAKDLVEAMERGDRVALNPEPPQAAFRGDMDAEARKLAAAGKIIDAIKLVRERTGLGLKEAKDYVERL